LHRDSKATEKDKKQRDLEPKPGVITLKPDMACQNGKEKSK
jgi:hypothetical protein